MRALEDLVEAARRGDASAQTELVQRFSRRISAIARRRMPRKLRSRYDTVDIVQSVLAELHRDITRFEYRSDREFVGWLDAKTRSKVTEKLRRNLGRGGRRWESHLVQAVVLRDPNPTPLSQIQSEEMSTGVRLALEGLAFEERQVLMLRTRDELRFAEIASCLELVSGEAARKRYARALTRLAQEWKRRFP